MKKMIFILILAVCCLQINSFSQKTRAGFSAGAVFANMRGDIGGDDQSGKLKPGFTAGFIVDAPIKNNFSFQPGLHYIQKGRVEQESIPTIQDKITYELRYVELPLNFLYNTNGSRGNFYVGAGPSVGFNLPSKILTKIDGGLKSETDITFGNTSAEDLRGIDFGANAIMGFRLPGGFFVVANYTLGLRNLVPKGALVQGDVKNSCFGVSLGWLVKNK